MTFCTLVKCKNSDKYELFIGVLYMTRRVREITAFLFSNTCLRSKGRDFESDIVPSFGAHAHIPRLEETHRASELH